MFKCSQLAEYGARYQSSQRVGPRRHRPTTTGSRSRRLRRTSRLVGRIDRSRPAEDRVAFVPMKAPVTQLVPDREPTARRPLARLVGVDPDLAARGKK